MRKALLLAAAITLTAASLTTQPAKAAPLTCGCWCCMPAYYSTYTCRLSNGGTASCSTYCNLYC
ncbi:MAG TPA: hypothetical protein VHU81_13695 [Thermoanaerobaculia bacterium]|jgi:hypothetical protein|nr:hypothetical protein [Thermoanaerobaculia bacterium]